MDQSIEPAGGSGTETDDTHARAPGHSLIGGRYRLEALLGTGGMGCVYRAIDTHNGVSVAVKTIRPDLAQNTLVRSRLQREASIGACVHAPEVVRLLDHGEDANQGPYVVFEYLRGELLSNLLERTPLLDVTDAVEIAIDILRGLEAFHAAGVLHRDVKPENVFLVRDDNRPGSNRSATLIDFGLSRAVGLSAIGTERVTMDGIIAGTPEYMPPEQFQDAEDQDEHVDIYAAGVVLYQMLAGEQPFAGNEPGAVFDRALNEAARPLAEMRPGIDPDLADCVHRAMAREPRDRFPHARAMRLVLSHWLIAHRRGHAERTSDDDKVQLPMLPFGGVFASWVLARRRTAAAIAMSITLGVSIAIAWTPGHPRESSTTVSSFEAPAAQGAIEFHPTRAERTGDPIVLDHAHPAPPATTIVSHSAATGPTVRRLQPPRRPAPRSTIVAPHVRARAIERAADESTTTSSAAAQCAPSDPASVCAPRPSVWHGSLLPPTTDY